MNPTPTQGQTSGGEASRVHRPRTTSNTSVEMMRTASERLVPIDAGRGQRHGSVTPSSSPTASYLSSMGQAFFDAVTLRHLIGDMDQLQDQEAGHVERRAR